MLVAVTGTPGTGKTSACDVLARRGYAVVDLDDLARKGGYVVGRDEARQTDEVDVDALREHLRIPSKVAFLRSHYSHRMDVDLAIVLRCRPSVLGKRLEARGWPPEKVRENVEAEAIDVITQEAAERLPRVYEVDTTTLNSDQTADAVLGILQGRTKGRELGSVDWSEEVLSWY
ncbi:MAG TPA: adenylate kinase family protein [Thermoplasmata archaeon]|nr:adenylate kinase family protein [Thermoplasmata archaeon]